MVVSFGICEVHTHASFYSHPSRIAAGPDNLSLRLSFQVICALWCPCLKWCSSTTITSQGSTDPTGIARYDPVKRPTDILCCMIPNSKEDRIKLSSPPADRMILVPPSPSRPVICTCASTSAVLSMLVRAQPGASKRGEKQNHEHNSRNSNT